MEEAFKLEIVRQPWVGWTVFVNDEEEAICGSYWACVTYAIAYLNDLQSALPKA